MSGSQSNNGHQAPSAALGELRIVVLVFLLLSAVFVLRQTWLQQMAVTNSRPNVERLKGELVRLEQIKEEFSRFGSSHPDFLPFLAKYGIHPPVGTMPKP